MSFTTSTLAQSIDFDQPDNVTYGDVVDLTGTATSSATVDLGYEPPDPVFSTTTPDECSLAGANVTLIKVGTCTVVASQAGNTIFDAATPVTRSFTIAPKPVSVTLRDDLTSAEMTKTYDGGTSFTVPGTHLVVSGAVGAEQLVVTSAVGTIDDTDVGERTLTISSLVLGPHPDTPGVLPASYLVDPDSLTGTVTVAPKPLTLASVTAVSRHYDGTSTVSLSGTTLVGVVAADVADVSIDPTSDATLDEVAVGTRTATTQVTLAGSRASQYEVVQTTETVEITRRPLGVALRSGLARVYDGGVQFALASDDYQVTNLVTGESLTVTSTTGTLSARVVGTQVVTASALTFAPASGTSLTNYDLPTQVVGAASITPKPLAVAGTTGGGRIYDGTTAVTLTGASLVGVVPGDAVSLTGASQGTAVSAHAGTQAVGTAMGISGADAGNYTISQPAVSVQIAPRPLTVTGTTGTKIYDATTAVPLTGATLVGTVPGDVVVLSGATRGVLDAPGVGTRRVATSMTLTGAAAGNYSLTQSEVTAVVTPRPVQISLRSGLTRVFDGGVAFAIDPADAVVTGTLAGQTLRITPLTGTLSAPATGSRTVNLPRPTLVGGPGTDVRNYLAPASVEGAALVSPRPVTLTFGATRLVEGDGTPVTMAVNSSPAGVPVTVTYNGLTTAPTAPGSYVVVASVTDPNHVPVSITATMVILAPAMEPGTGGSVLRSAPNGEARVVETAVIADLVYQVANPATPTARLMPVLTPAEGRTLTEAPLAVTEVITLIDGQPETSSRTVVEQRRVEILTGDTRLVMATRTGDGEELDVDAEGSIRLRHNSALDVEGDGFAAGTQAEVWIFSTATFLGYAEVGADGGFAQMFTIPDYIDVGEHTIQLNGLDPQLRVRSTSLHVMVDEEVGGSASEGSSDAGGAAGVEVGHERAPRAGVDGVADAGTGAGASGGSVGVTAWWSLFVIALALGAWIVIGRSRRRDEQVPVTHPG